MSRRRPRDCDSGEQSEHPHHGGLYRELPAKPRRGPAVERARRGARDAARRSAELVWRGLLMPWVTETFLDPADAALVESKRPAFLQAFLACSPVIDGVPESLVARLVEHMTLTGDLHDIERIAGHLRQLEDAGLDEVALRLHDEPEEGLRLIGEHLLPALA